MFDNAIPIPEINNPRNNKYNLHKMAEGDSFKIPFEPTKAQRLRVAICNYARRNKKQFITRKLEENGDWILRVWRVD